MNLVSEVRLFLMESPVPRFPGHNTVERQEKVGTGNINPGDVESEVVKSTGRILPLEV